MTRQPADIMERLRAGAGALQSRLPEILSNPREYPQESMILLAAAAVALLLAALIALLVSDVIKAWAARRGLGVRRKGLGLLRTLLVVAGVAGIALLALALVPLVPPAGAACGSCHAVKAATAAWRADAHAGVACYGCHARPGLLGAVQASTGGLAALVGGDRPQGADSGRCLACHRDIETVLVERGGLRMRHADIIEAEMDCLLCHPGVGHARQDATEATLTAAMDADVASPMSRSTSDRSRMGRCLVCHDGERASSACSGCHLTNASDRITADWQLGDVATLSRCDSCHAEETQRRCVACHGLELPHPAGFMREHARLSAGTPSLCARCHESASDAEACRCHQDGEVHGNATAWFEKHGEAAVTAWPGGCRCHQEQFCLWCHDTLPATAPGDSL